MRTFLPLFVAGSLITCTANSAVCVGKNCELIDTAAQNMGLSLNHILSEIDRNIVDPIVDSQRMIASWEGGMLQFTPRGSEKAVKITLWGGGSWRYVDIKSTSPRVPIHFGYYTGNTSISFGIEIPINDDDELIVNSAFWTGSSDYGLGISQYGMKETNGRLGAGFRHRLYKSSLVNVFTVNGFILGYRNANMNLAGSIVELGYFNEKLTWSGEENYHEKSTYFTSPVLLGISFNAPNVTLSISGGGNFVFQQGSIDMSKWGPVGPYGGYHNVGVRSFTDITGFTLVPVASLGAESSLENGPSFSINFRPGINSAITGGSVGIGWKFLTFK